MLFRATYPLLAKLLLRELLLLNNLLLLLLLNNLLLLLLLLLRLALHRGEHTRLYTEKSDTQLSHCHSAGKKEKRPEKTSTSVYSRARKAFKSLYSIYRETTKLNFKIYTASIEYGVWAKNEGSPSEVHQEGESLPKIHRARSARPARPTRSYSTRAPLRRVWVCVRVCVGSRWHRPDHLYDSIWLNFIVEGMVMIWRPFLIVISLDKHLLEGLMTSSQIWPRVIGETTKARLLKQQMMHKIK